MEPRGPFGSEGFSRAPLLGRCFTLSLEGPELTPVEGAEFAEGPVCCRPREGAVSSRSSWRVPSDARGGRRVADLPPVESGPVLSPLTPFSISF